MQLNPKQPPGHAKRKALRYANEVHRLRAEGHTLEAIRQALLDAGVSVSVSTVWREANRPPSDWGLAPAKDVLPTLDELPPCSPTPATAATATTPQQFGANSDLPSGITSARSAPAIPDGVRDRSTLGLLSRLVEALRRLGRAGQVP
ncbi:hypothetical protein [Ideonella sp. A 288]|uniref:hypothetical protein n=1 Tax=Ideonella sp. A 288 TaxID=1962181 RepID=UPI001184EA62|nr:hypothetical protein [Ideonella sp. A 288]